MACNFLQLKTKLSSLHHHCPVVLSIRFQVLNAYCVSRSLPISIGIHVYNSLLQIMGKRSAHSNVPGSSCILLFNKNIKKKILTALYGLELLNPHFPDSQSSKSVLWRKSYSSFSCLFPSPQYRKAPDILSLKCSPDLLSFVQLVQTFTAMTHRMLFISSLIQL